MNKFWKFFTREVVQPHPVPEYIIYNLDNFNNWFNAKDNGAVYAHPGIFLRLDKLSMPHLADYIEKCYGIKKPYFENKDVEFMKLIREDWRKRLNANYHKNKTQKKIR